MKTSTDYYKPVCCECKQKPKEMVDSTPTWYGIFRGDKLKIAICVDCYRSGKRDKYDNFKG